MVHCIDDSRRPSYDDSYVTGIGNGGATTTTSVGFFQHDSQAKHFLNISNYSIPSMPFTEELHVINICHPKLIKEFINEAAVYPDDDEFNQLNDIDSSRYANRFTHNVGSSYTISKGGNMNR